MEIADTLADPASQEAVYTFGPFALSEAERVLRRNGVLVPLPPKAYAVLSTLVKAEGRVVAKGAMLAAVWPDTFVEETVLPQTMSILRRHLATNKTQESPIETISKVGYRLRIPVVLTPDLPHRRSIVHAEALGIEERPLPAAPLPTEYAVETQAAPVTGKTSQRTWPFLPRDRFKVLASLACLLVAAVFALSYSRGSQVVGLQQRLRQSAQTEQEAATPASALPQNAQARRLYLEGVQKLRSFDSTMAAHALEESIALEPDFALSHTELAHAVTLLGQADQALAEAHKGRALSAHLSRVDQLRVQSVCEATEHRFEAAAATYGILFALVPQELEYARSQASLLENAGHNKEAVVLLEPLMQGPSQGPVTAVSEMTIGQGYSNMGDFARARIWAKRSEDDAKGRGDLMLYERALTAEADALTAMRQFGPALQKAQEALELSGKLGDQAGALQALTATAQIRTGMGLLPEAQHDLLRVLTQAMTLGQTQKQIYTLNALGENSSKMGESAQALTYFQRSAALARSFGLIELVHRAEFDAAGEQARLGRKSEATRALSLLLDEAINSGDKIAAQRAKRALLGIASARG